MHKRFILIVFCIIISSNLWGQTKLGIRFTPNLLNNRVFNLSDTATFNPSNPKWSYMIGLLIDKSISNNYIFSTGLFYSKKTASISIANSSGNKIDESYQIDYLQIPISLKLYTNEIQPETTIFFQIGGTVDFNIFDSPNDKSSLFIEDFQVLDVSALLGVGVEYKIGINTVLLGGISYNRGLLNTIKKSEPIDDPLILKISSLNFDLGIKF